MATRNGELQELRDALQEAAIELGDRYVEEMSDVLYELVAAHGLDLPSTVGLWVPQR